MSEKKYHHPRKPGRETSPIEAYKSQEILGSIRLEKKELIPQLEKKKRDAPEKKVHNERGGDQRHGGNKLRKNLGKFNRRSGGG